MYEDTVFMKGSTRNHEAVRCGKPYKFFVICPIDTSGFSIAAMLPNTEKVAIFLKDTLCCPLAQSITDSAFEELIALQANNGLTLEDPTGAKVWVVKSNSIEMVGRKVARLLMAL